MLPSTAQLLVEGGDARIVLDPLSAINQYGCPALPDPDLLAFGSSTASVISPAGYAAADRLRERLQQAVAREPAETVYSRELERVRHELAELAGVADLPGLEIVFATSGTDLHLIAAQLAASHADTGADTSVDQPLQAIMIEAAETGSHVSAALGGRHFSVCAASLPHDVADEGTAIGGAETVVVANVSVRLEDGSPRPCAAVDAEVEALVGQAAARSQRVLLILVDVSKTGLLAPSPACVATLKQRFPLLVDVMVDACQFRIAAATLRAYLELGFMVALTGSKFMTGPTFSGALLLPRSLAATLRRRSPPDALWAYSCRAEWPAGWAVAGLAHYANFGLLLRWEAALTELRAFSAVPAGTVAYILEAFARAVQTRLEADPLLVALDVPPLDRCPLIEATGWDHIQTIFPFLMRHPDGTFLTRAETARVYQLLQAGDADDGVRCQFGQPVPCGRRGEIPVSALRLCASARLVVEAARDEHALTALISRAMLALDKTVALVREMSAA